MIDWKFVQQMIADADRILLTTHENPDGDGIGCASAMQYYLQDIGKDSRILCTSELPYEYGFFQHAKDYSLYSKTKHAEWIAGADLAIVFDIGDFSRLRGIGEQLKINRIKTLNIDHHIHTTNGNFSYDLIDLKAAATGEMLYDFFKTIYQGLLPLAIAEGIYTAIMTDTGSFRYSNTNQHCHAIAIECINAGIKPHAIYQQIYESSSIARVKLLGAILNNINFDFDGELAWFKIDQAMLDRCSATRSDVDGFTDFIRTIRGVEIALMIFQNGDDSCRINFRSKGKYNIHGVAQEMGGGGHPFAAGAVVAGSLDTVTEKVLQATIKSLNSQNGNKQP
ncbi:MAG: bifunctional oligoribonuclease/PAP phosphatase NrnA [Candidatus Marinimicrobia bacterium]|nr:bifunctional oligoribonuclease/PAP phosphatase NrnA [Candidatus Neomarinimicrobiota bacterium]